MKLKLLSILVGSSLCLAAGAQATTSPVSLNLSPVIQVADVKTIDINTSSAQEISDVLVGVGVKRAEQIIQLREQLGGFTEVEQLLDVKGIGLKTLEKNRSFITIKQ